MGYKMRYIKSYKIFESNDDEIKSEVSDILADLSDNYFECQVHIYSASPYSKGKIRSNIQMLSVFIDRKGHTDRGVFRGKPFRISEIQSDIDNLINQISDRCSLHAVTISNMRTESKKHHSGFNIHIGDKTWTDPWEYVKDTTDFDVKWVKLEFEIN